MMELFSVFEAKSEVGSIHFFKIIIIILYSVDRGCTWLLLRRTAIGRDKGLAQKLLGKNLVCISVQHINVVLLV